MKSEWSMSQGRWTGGRRREAWDGTQRNAAHRGTTDYDARVILAAFAFYRVTSLQLTKSFIAGPERNNSRNSLERDAWNLLTTVSASRKIQLSWLLQRVRRNVLWALLQFLSIWVKSVVIKMGTSSFSKEPYFAFTLMQVGTRGFFLMRTTHV